jgi:probable rRNA maturation factor
VKLKLEISDASSLGLSIDAETLSGELERELSPEFGDMRASVAVTCVSDDEIRGLNARYRDVDEATDVLSFPLWEDGGRFAPPVGWEELPLGDVVVSPDFVRQNAARENLGYNNEMTRMIVHGVLHLVGFDHDTEARKRGMWEIQERVVARCERVADGSGED